MGCFGFSLAVHGDGISQSQFEVSDFGFRIYHLPPLPPHEPPCGAPTFLSAWFEELAHADKNVGAPTARFRGSKRASLVRRNLSRSNGG